MRDRYRHRRERYCEKERKKERKKGRKKDVDTKKERDRQTDRQTIRQCETDTVIEERDIVRKKERKKERKEERKMWIRRKRERERERKREKYWQKERDWEILIYINSRQCFEKKKKKERSETEWDNFVIRISTRMYFRLKYEYVMLHWQQNEFHASRLVSESKFTIYWRYAEPFWVFTCKYTKYSRPVNKKNVRFIIYMSSKTLLFLSSNLYITRFGLKNIFGHVRISNDFKCTQPFGAKHAVAKKLKLK